MADRCPPIPDVEPIELPPAGHARYHVRVDHGALQIYTASSPLEAMQDAASYLRMTGRLDPGQHHGAVKRDNDVDDLGWSSGAFVVSASGAVSIGAVRDV